MAWSWSHTPEAYYNAKQNLGDKDRQWLEVCYAEIQAAEREEDYLPYRLDIPAYDKALERAKELDDCILGAGIWEFAETYRTCDNGSWNAYMCLFGCHVVPFGTREEDDSRYRWE